MCGQTSTDNITFINTVQVSNAVNNSLAETTSKTIFPSFNFFGVTKTTALYNTTYFDYGGIVGLAYPTS